MFYFGRLRVGLCFPVSTPYQRFQMWLGENDVAFMLILIDTLFQNTDSNSNLEFDSYGISENSEYKVFKVTASWKFQVL